VFGPIRGRLVAWTMLVVGLILALAGVAVYGAMSATLVGQVDRFLITRVDQAMRDPRMLLVGLGDPEIVRYRAGAFFLVVADDGRVLLNPQRIDTSGLELATAVGVPGQGVTAELGGEEVRLLAVPLPTERVAAPMRLPRKIIVPAEHSAAKLGEVVKARIGAPPFGIDGVALVVGQSLASERRALELLFTVLGATALVGLALAFCGAWFLAGRALIPIQLAFKRQQQFTADASHELRTPLTVIKSATDLLDRHREEPLSANADLLDDVRSEIVRLQRLTNDLLTLARSDNGSLELAMAEVGVAPLVEDLARQVDPLARERGIDLRAQTEPDAGFVEADPDRLRQVLLILADNALAHTPRGGRVTMRARSDDGHSILEVADTGPGIPKEQIARVFERFYRAESARHRASGDGGGAGLGLAIARSLVDAHKGELTLFIPPEGGTVARIRLPRVGARSVTTWIEELPARVSRLARGHGTGAG